MQHSGRFNWGVATPSPTWIHLTQNPLTCERNTRAVDWACGLRGTSCGMYDFMCCWRTRVIYMSPPDSAYVAPTPKKLTRTALILITSPMLGVMRIGET